jgi:hypothetical protein
MWAYPFYSGRRASRALCSAGISCSGTSRDPYLPVHITSSVRIGMPVTAVNYARLVEIKKKFDPNNVLRLNQNIEPDSPSNS